jgi:hypothetical protein
MNYQEIRQMAEYEPWVAKYKAKIDAENALILTQRQESLDKHTEIIVGDFVLMDGKALRVSHVWDDSVQTTDGRYGASFYLGNGYVSFSGGLDPAIPLDKFHLTGDKREGDCWFFSQDHARAHNGVHVKALFKVWQVKP